MDEHVRPPEFAGRDYDAIEAAVLETEGGRWFLSEFRRRNRGADTQTVLQAIRALEQRIKALQAAKSAAGWAVPRPGAGATASLKGPAAGSKARAALPADNRAASPAVKGKVVLEKVFAGKAKEPARLSEQNLRYFVKDEELFAPLPARQHTSSLTQKLPDPNSPLPHFLVRKDLPQAQPQPPAANSRTFAGAQGRQADEIARRRIIVRTALGTPPDPLADEGAATARQAG